MKELLNHDWIAWIPYLTAGVCGIGLAGKCIFSLWLTRLIKESRNMPGAKSRIFKQIKLKFENCFRLNKGIHNIDTFLDKYLYRHRFLGMTLHRWNRLPGLLSLICLLLGTAGGWSSYLGGAGHIWFYPAAGATGMLFLLLLNQLSDTGHKSRILKANVKDFLENSLQYRLKQELENAVDKPLDPEVEMDIAYMKKSLEQIAAGNTKGASGGRVLIPPFGEPGQQETGNKPAKMSREEEEKVFQEVMKEFFS